MQLTGIDFLFWAAGFCAALILVAVLWTRHRAEQFPFFTALVTASIVRTIALYCILRGGSKHEYLIAYLSFGTIDVVLQLCVIYELATQVFRPTGKWASDIRSSLIVMVCGSLTVALALTLLTTPPANSLMRSLLIKGNFLSSVLTAELFVGMSVLSATVRLPWKTHAARIAQGLGVYTVIGILTEAGHSLFGLDRNAHISAAFSHIRMSSYLLCLGYWITMLWREAPAPRPLPEEMRLQLFSLQRRVEYDLQRLRSWKRL